MKKVFSMILILALLMSVVPVQAFAVSSPADFEYTLDDGNNVTISAYKGKGGDITIPGTIDGHPVTMIGDNAFSECTKMTSISIPEGVTNIGAYAFSYCENLKSVTIPKSVTGVDIGAFKECTKLTTVIILNSAATIDEKAFSGTPWNAVANEFMIDKNGVLIAYNGAGGDVILPSSVKTIGGKAFADCATLRSITIPPGVTVADAYVDTEEDILAGNITGGEPGAFYNCKNLKSLVLPEGMTHIGNKAFIMCSGLTSITIPSSVTSIGEDAFQGCTGLKSLTIPNSVTKIDEAAFEACTGLKSITIPNSVETIGLNVFMGCKNLISVTIPSSVTAMGAFASDLPAGDSPFAYCDKLTAINVDKENPMYSSEDGVLFNKDKTILLQYPPSKAGASYTIPASVTDMAHASFLICKNIKTVVIPKGVTIISDSQFYACRNLTSLVIPNGVERIAPFAFKGCSSLKSLTLPPSLISTGEGAFSNCPKTMRIYGVAGSHAQTIAKDGGWKFIAIKKQ